MLYENEPELKQIWENLSPQARETLGALIYDGPLWDGDVPSKVGRDELLRLKLANKAIVKRQQGYQTANYTGWAVYRVSHPLEFEHPSTIMESALMKARIQWDERSEPKP